MSIVTITLSGRNFKLTCSEGDKHHIEKLAEKLDLELSEISSDNPSASFEMLLVMISLGLMNDKHSKDIASCEEVLGKAETDYKKQLALVFDKLKIVANKF